MCVFVEVDTHKTVKAIYNILLTEISNFNISAFQLTDSIETLKIDFCNHEELKGMNF